MGPLHRNWYKISWITPPNIMQCMSNYTACRHSMPFHSSKQTTTPQHIMTFHNMLWFVVVVLRLLQLCNMALAGAGLVLGAATSVVTLLHATFNSCHNNATKDDLSGQHQTLMDSRASGNGTQPLALCILPATDTRNTGTCRLVL